MTEMNLNLNTYTHTANYYDFDYYAKSKCEIAFYKKLIVGNYTEVLELCCGTGRITIPLAIENVKIFALDFSKEMLAILINKVASQQLGQRVTVANANIINFSLGKEFECVLIAFHSFQSLITEGHINACIKQIYDHLSVTGVFILNLFIPDFVVKSTEGKMETKIISNENKEEIAVKYITNDYVDEPNQIIYFHTYYRTLNNTQTVPDRFAVKYYTFDQISILLTKNNFKIIRTYEGFESENPSDKSSGEITLVCKKNILHEGKIHS